MLFEVVESSLLGVWLTFDSQLKKFIIGRTFSCTSHRMAAKKKLQPTTQN